MSSLKHILSSFASPITDRVFQLKNRHQGESCYIYGDGISIKWFDLSALPKKLGFTLSCIPFHNQADRLDLRYGLLIEPYYFYPYLKMPSWSTDLKWWRNKINKKYVKTFKSNPNSSYFVNLSNYPVLTGDNIYYIFRHINDSDFELSNECKSNNIGIFDGSFRCAISLAIYMGFDDIVLVGCDYTHQQSRSLHWYEKGEGVIMQQPNYEREFLEIAQKYASITTITLGGCGTVLPSTTYTDYTRKQLAFHENDELLNDETLSLLATWPGYKIF